MKPSTFLLAVLLPLAPAVGQAPPANPGAGNEPARELTERGQENLAAFTRLLGFVRYFHPSDQAAAIDWSTFAIAGVQRAETAKDAAELARTLEDLFLPIAPTVRVFPTRSYRPALPGALQRPAAGPVRTVAWRHLGVTLGPNTDTVFRSARADDRDGLPDITGRVEQDVDATPFRGKTVRLRAAMRAELPAGQSSGAFSGAFSGKGASLWLRVQRPEGQPPFETTSPPIAAGPWREVEVSGEVAADAERISIGLILDRPGKVWVDDVSFGTEGGVNPVFNPSFEGGLAGQEPAGWSLMPPRHLAGYSWTRSEEPPRPPQGGRFSGLLAGADPRSLITAKPGEPFVADLGGGVSALVPLALWADDQGTLPHPTDLRPPAPDKPEGFRPTGDDRATRLAEVALAWNIFQHFYPYFDAVGTDWPALLRPFLREAATDAGDAAFFNTLRRMIAALHDGHGLVIQGSMMKVFTPPFAWDWIENQLVVTWVASDEIGLRPGDAILSLDGKPARQAFESAVALTSAATLQRRRYQALVLLSEGPKDQEVRLEVQPLEGPAKTVTVRRTLPFFGPGSLAVERWKSQPAPIAELRPGIFYVDGSRISDADLAGALDRLAAAQGIVFDFREHGMGLSNLLLERLADRPLYTRGWQIPLITRPDFRDVTWARGYQALVPKAPRLNAKIAFLSGAGSFSFPEGVLQVVEAFHLGEIVGGPTAGTNGNANLFALPGGYQFMWTGMKVVKDDGTPLHGIGVRPTVPVAPTRAGVAAGRDEVLERALEVVGR